MWRIAALLTVAGCVAAHSDTEQESKDDISSDVPKEYGSYARSYAGASGMMQPADASRRYMSRYADAYSKYMTERGPAGSDSSDADADYIKYVKKYADDFADLARPGADGMGGNYQQFMEKGNSYQHLMKKYEGDSSKYYAQAGPKDSSPTVMFLAEAGNDASVPQEEPKPTAEERKAKAAAEAEEAKQDEGDAEAHARHAIQDLHDFAANERSQVKSAAKESAQAIASDVHEDFDKLRQELQQQWHSDLAVLDPSQLAGANWSDVKTAMDSIIHVRNELNHLDHEEARAVHRSFEAKMQEAKSHARALGKEARKAAHEMNAQGRRVEDRQKAAGQKERSYEREQEESERLAEELEDKAESASDAAQDAVEERFQLVQDHIEQHMKDMQHDAQKFREERKRAVRDAARAVAHAHKEAAHNAAASPALFLAAAPANSTPPTPAQEAETAQEEEQKVLAEARHATEELNAFAEREHQHVRKTSREMAELIQSRVQATAEAPRKQLEQLWEDQLSTLSSGQPGAVNNSELKAAVEAVSKTKEALHHLDEEERRSIRHGFEELLKATQAHVHALGKKARRATEQAEKMSWRVEAHQEAAGVRERQRERSQEDSEREAEDLQDRVETATDEAQQAVEEKYQLVEGHLERLVDAMQEAASRQNAKRKEAEREALKKMAKVRAEAAKHEQPVSGSAPAILLAATEEEGTTEATSDEADPASEAEAAIREIHDFAAQEHDDVKKGADDVVSGIESKVHEAFQDQREMLQKRWQSALEGLDATKLSEADKKEVQHAVNAADEAEEGLRKLGHEELRALRHAFRDSREEQKKHVRSLAGAAKKATKDAKKAREHGEKAAGLTEHAIEELEDAGERAKERAQDVLEEKFNHIEHAVEKRIDDLEDNLQDEHEQRRKQLHQAEKAVEKARHEAKKSSEDSAEAAKEDQTAGDAQPAKTPGAFLAQTPTDGLPLRSLNFYVVASLMAGMLVFAGLRQSCPSRHVAIGEQPALG